LRRRLAEHRSVAVGNSVVATMTRTIAVRDRTTPSVDTLSPEAAATALTSVVVLAPLLDRSAADRARGIVNDIDPVHLQMEPLIRLAELDGTGDVTPLADAVRRLPQIAGGLDRLRAVVDRLIALVQLDHARMLAPLTCTAIDSASTDDVAVLFPLAVALGDGRAYAKLRATLAALASWFGAAEASPPQRQSRETPPLVLPVPAAGAALVAGCARAGDWTTAGRLLAMLRAGGDGTGTGAAQAEESLVNLFAALPAPLDPVATGLVREVAANAPTRPRRLRALTALLRRFSACDGDRVELVRLLDSPELALVAGESTDPEIVATATAAVHGWIALGHLERVAAIVQFLTAEEVPYRMATGRLLTSAARAVSSAVDGADLAPADRRHGEDALTAYFDYVVHHHEDYTLQEAAGVLLRDRVVDARTASRVVEPSLLSMLESLADADEPMEVILHELAVSGL
jgi:hypothetical protein